MNGKANNIVDSVLIALGVTFGLNEIESLLGIIILSVQILWIFVKVGIKIYHNIKDNNASGVADNIKDLHDELVDLQEDLKDKEDEKNGKR